MAYIHISKRIYRKDLLYYNKEMKKKILISIEEEAIDAMDQAASKLGLDRSSYIVYLASSSLSGDKRKILPKNLLGKDEMAKYLNITPLEKEYSLFQDRITEERVYNPERMRNQMM